MLTPPAAGRQGAADGGRDSDYLAGGEPLVNRRRERMIGETAQRFDRDRQNQVEQYRLGEAGIEESPYAFRIGLAVRPVRRGAIVAAVDLAERQPHDLLLGRGNMVAVGYPRERRYEQAERQGAAGFPPALQQRTKAQLEANGCRDLLRRAELGAGLLDLPARRAHRAESGPFRGEPALPTNATVQLQRDGGIVTLTRHRDDCRDAVDRPAAQALPTARGKEHAPRAHAP